LIVGCTWSDPVKGWKSWDVGLAPPNDHIVNKAIIEDYHNFFETLKNPYPGTEAVYYFVDEKTGRQAIKISMQEEYHRYVYYYLMYDKSNVRTKVIKMNAPYEFHGFGQIKTQKNESALI
jgi:hypothetical protein